MRPEIQVDVIASCPCIFFSFYLVCFEEKSKLLVLSVSPRSYFVIAELERSITSVLHMYLNLIRINFGGKYSWWFYVIVWFLFLLHWFQYCCLLCMLCSSSRVLDWLDSFAPRKLVDPRKLLLKGICPINCSHEKIVYIVDKLHNVYSRARGHLLPKSRKWTLFAAHRPFDQFSVCGLQLLKRLECWTRLLLS